MTFSSLLIPEGLDGFEFPTLSICFVVDDLRRPHLNILDRIAGSAVESENIVIVREPQPVKELWATLGLRSFGEEVVE